MPLFLVVNYWQCRLSAFTDLIPRSEDFFRAQRFNSAFAVFVVEAESLCLL